jgi:hypothetical protein
VTELMHWHKPDEMPSRLAPPPGCCQNAFEHVLDQSRDEADRTTDDAVREERRRVVTSTVEALESYRRSITSVVSDPEQLALADKVAAYCAEVVRRAGCICEPVELRSFGEAKPRQVVGRVDPLCGVHEAGAAA